MKISQRVIYPIIGISILVLIAILTFYMFNNTGRSKEAYCSSYNTELQTLKSLTRGNFPSELFQVQLSDVSALKRSYVNIEKSAPDEIAPSVKTMIKIYDDLEKNPSDLITASITAKDVDNSIYEWTKSNCVK